VRGAVKPWFVMFVQGHIAGGELCVNLQMEHIMKNIKGADFSWLEKGPSLQNSWGLQGVVCVNIQLVKLTLRNLPI